MLVPEAMPTLDELQYAALIFRPEMRQALYSMRGAERDTLRRTVEAFPSLMLSYGAYYDSNSFLVNNHWRQSSASLSMDLVRLASIPFHRRLGRVNEEMAEARTELQSLAIMSQVAIARKAWHAASVDACLSEQLARIDSRKLELFSARAQAAALDRLTVIRSEVDNLLFRIESALDRAEMRRAGLMLMSSVGVGPVPDGFSSEDGAGKALEIDAWLTGGMQHSLLTNLADLVDDESLISEGTDNPDATQIEHEGRDQDAPAEQVQSEVIPGESDGARQNEERSCALSL